MKLTDIEFHDIDKELLLIAMKEFFEFVSSNEIDTKTKTSVIAKSEEAGIVKKLMHGINSLN